MALQVDIKKGSTLVTTLTSVGEAVLNTKRKYIDDYITIDVVSGGGGGVDPSDATATAANILAGKTAYIATGKTTGTLASWSGSLKPSIEGLDYLCFTANIAKSRVTCPLAFAFSTDKENWQIANTSKAIVLANAGDKLYLKKGNYVVVEDDFTMIGTFNLSGNITASGNIMSLIDETCTRIDMPVGGGTFQDLFNQQTALTNIAQLKLTATNLSEWCYSQMFRGTSITIPPALPATILAEGCYLAMFMECPLTTLPGLIATDYPQYSCGYMLSGWPTTFSVFTTSSDSHPYEWRVPMSGTGTTSGDRTFEYMIVENTGGDAPITPVINTTYYVENPPVMPGQNIPNYLCFTANTAGSTVTCPVAFEYSSDGITWSTATSSAITLANVGDKIYLRNGSVGDPLYLSGYGTFTMTGSIAASGNVMSLIDNTVTSTTLTVVGSFNSLFKNCTSLTSAPNLPATNASAIGVYYLMFAGCTNLVTGPARIAVTNPGLYCCNQMFEDCTSLITPPVLEATSLGDASWYLMFKGCTSLTTVPHIGATTFSNSSMYNMFEGCTSLTTVNALVASHFPDYCCAGMYRNCSQLIVSETLLSTTPYVWTMPMTGSATSGQYPFGDIFDGCQSEGTTWMANYPVYTNLQPI